MFFSAKESSVRMTQDIYLGDFTGDGLLTLRGYPVNFTVSETSWADIKLCGPGVFDQQADRGLFNWRFRWIQTAVANGSTNNDDAMNDVIHVYNVSITLVNGTENSTFFRDDFSGVGNLRYTE